MFVFSDLSLASALYVLATFNSKIYHVVEIRRNLLDHWFPTFKMWEPSVTMTYGSPQDGNNTGWPLPLNGLWTGRKLPNTQLL